MRLAYSNRGLTYVSLGKFGKALQDYTRAIELDSRFRDAYYNRADLRCKTGEFNKAIGDYTEAIRIDPTDFVAYYDRGAAYYAKASYDLAIADYTGYPTTTPRTQPLYVRWRTMHAAVPMPRKAIMSGRRRTSTRPASWGSRPSDETFA